MTQHFNGLTPAEAERLAMLAEECGEVIQMVGKILRHGYESHHPDRPDVTNRALLTREMTDLFAVAHQMQSMGDVAREGSEVSIDKAWLKKLRYAHHQED